MSGRFGFHLLDTHDLERIHCASLGVLERTGILIRHVCARQLLQSEGAHVDETSDLVRIPPELVSRAIDSSPGTVVLQGLGADPSVRDLIVGADGLQYTRSGSGLNSIVDHCVSKRRPVGRQDVVNWVRLNQALANIHIVSALFDQERSPQTADVRSMAVMLQYTDKPLMTSAMGGKGIRIIKRMVEAVQNPTRMARVMVLSSVNSPLLYSADQTEAALACAEEGFPVAINSSSMASAAGPATLSGNVTLMHAEMLAALTIIQLHRPGAPVSLCRASNRNESENRFRLYRCT